MKEEEPPYQLNDKCLAYHGPLLYEAKIIKSHQPGSKDVLTKDKKEIKVEKASEADIPTELEDELSFYIHYKGWKTSWDEWVGLRRLRAYNIENLRLQKELKNAALNSTSTVSASSGRRQTDGKQNNGSTRSGKRRGELDLEKEEDYLKRPEINILIPDPLKSLLVDDWEIITKEHQLIELPAKPSVNDILKQYRQSVGKKGGNTEAEILDEFLSGLKVYFNRSLGNLLLYRFERQQFLNLTKDPEFSDRELSSIYGPEHLMRLMVTLPALIAQTTMDQQSVGTLKEHIEDFLKYLDKNKKDLFLKRYENVSPSYEAQAKNA